MYACICIYVCSIRKARAKRSEKRSAAKAKRSEAKAKATRKAKRRAAKRLTKPANSAWAGPGVRGDARGSQGVLEPPLRRMEQPPIPPWVHLGPSTDFPRDPPGSSQGPPRTPPGGFLGPPGDPPGTSPRIPGAPPGTFQDLLAPQFSGKSVPGQLIDYMVAFWDPRLHWESVWGA